MKQNNLKKNNEKDNKNVFEIKYEKENEIFKILVYFDEYEIFLENIKEGIIWDVLFDTKIFDDTKKGLVKSKDSVEKCFNKKSEEEILREIILNGKCQIPTEFLNKKRDEIKEKVVNYIVENSMNPTNNLKFSFSMIKSETEKIKFNFDPNKNFINQAEEILEILKKNFPIKLNILTLVLKVPKEFVGRFFKEFRKFGKITKESFDNHGSLHIHIQFLESKKDLIIEFIKKNSNNRAEYHIDNN